MKLAAVVILLFFSSCLNSQVATSLSTVDTNCVRFEEKDSVVYLAVEVLPEFPGGEAAFFRFMHEQLRLPADSECYSGTVYFSFIVLRDGRIANVEIVKGAANCEGLNAAVSDALCRMPRWKPGMNNGKPVSVKYTQRIIVEFQK